MRSKRPARRHPRSVRHAGIAVRAFHARIHGRCRRKAGAGSWDASGGWLGQSERARAHHADTSPSGQKGILLLRRFVQHVRSRSLANVPRLSKADGAPHRLTTAWIATTICACPYGSFLLPEPAKRHTGWSVVLVPWCAGRQACSGTSSATSVFGA